MVIYEVGHGVAYMCVYAYIIYVCVCVCLCVYMYTIPASKAAVSPVY